MGLTLFKLLSVVFDGHLLLFYIIIHEHRLQFILNEFKLQSVELYLRL